MCSRLVSFVLSFRRVVFDLLLSVSNAVNPDLPFMSSSDVTSMQSSAFVDPSDVTVIYTTQPVMERSAQPSSRTLRRRNVGSS
mmetsp:Transcript_3728/g.8205  ORF Transcript_3728/g.8205 Transcript_3728/m.8205 type:complete len:83 (+) Transcript_3728:603-851(+)